MAHEGATAILAVGLALTEHSEEFNSMKTLCGYGLLAAGVAGHAMASVVTPEIGASTAMGALALVSGAVLVLRSRRK